MLVKEEGEGGSASQNSWAPHLQNRSPHPSTRKLSTGILLFMTLMVAILLVEPFLKIPLHIPLNYNEGWNAYFAERAMSGIPLYSGKEALITNNYPPLSFYIVGLLGLINGDTIIAGRILALVSFFIVALNIMAIIQWLTRDWVLSWLGGILLCGIGAVFFKSYVGMNDPQWLAHAVMTTGFTIFLIRLDTMGVWIASFIMITAGMIKHLLLPLPLAITIWLLLYHRKLAAVWIAASLTGILVYGFIFWQVYGPRFLESLMNPRSYSLVNAITGFDIFWKPMLPLMGINIALAFFNFREKSIQLLLMYSFFSFVLGVVMLVGEGVSSNAVFDFVIGTCICSGLAIHQLRHFVGTKELFQGSKELFGMTILALIILFSTPSQINQAHSFLINKEEIVSSSEFDIDFLKSQRGPVMCEQLALCYWAGKPLEVDFFNTGQKMRKGVIPESNLTRLLAQQYFSVIQVVKNPSSPFQRLPDGVNNEIMKSYTVQHASLKNGFFLTPRKS